MAQCANIFQILIDFFLLALCIYVFRYYYYFINIIIIYYTIPRNDWTAPAPSPRRAAPNAFFPQGLSKIYLFFNTLYPAYSRIDREKRRQREERESMSNISTLDPSPAFTIQVSLKDLRKAS